MATMQRGGKISAFQFQVANCHGLIGQKGESAAKRLLLLGWIVAFVLMMQSGFSFAAVNVALGQASAVRPVPNVAFYYLNDPPVDELQAFDVVVIDPARAQPPKAELTPHTSWLARLHFSGKNSLANVNDSVVATRIDQLWEQGFRGFLLDDGAKVDAAGTEQDNLALAATIDVIRTRHPDAQILLRNHLSVARIRAEALSGLVIDSLYHRPGGFGGLMAKVPDATRSQLAGEIRQIQSETSLPVIAVDYCAAFDKPCRRDLAQRLMQDGLQPFVTAPGMGTVGIGRIEVMPRKVLVVQSIPKDITLEQSVGVMAIAMPLNYLGYDIRYVDMNTQALPTDISGDRYAGIVVAMDQASPRAGMLRQWLLARIREGLRVAVVGNFGFPMDGSTAAALGLEAVSGSLPPHGRSQVVSQAPMMGFETMPAPDVRYALGIRVGQGGHSLLRLKYGDYLYDAAALTSWGGYVLSPYGVLSQNAIDQDRWAIQPLDFLKQALQLPDMPVPDVTSENGRRLMFTHVDGDGFVSTAEFASAADQFSGQVLYDQVITRYPIPMTMSVIEGETGPEGEYPEHSAALEAIARKIFASPNVEIGSHTFSHPFFFSEVDNTTGKHVKPFYQPPDKAADPFSLPIPNYEFNLDREIFGTIDYINQRLAPPGKKVEAILWSGDAEAPALALRKAAQAGVLNINGGSTVITKSNNSWINIAPYGVAKGERPDEYQVYAATMNENVYTDDWLGPFYRFNRVLETFAMTDEPVRFKAVDIYYHFYSATKLASLTALHQIFTSVMKQPVFPIYTTEYIKRVLQWRRVSVARQGDEWIVRSGTDLRQLRWPGQEVPVLATAKGVAGYMPGPGGLYIHMGGDEASFRMAPKTQQSVPYVREASGFIRNFRRQGRDMQFELGGYYKPFVQLADVSGCTPQVAGKGGRAKRSANTWRLEVTGIPAKPVAYHTIRVHCE